MSSVSSPVQEGKKILNFGKKGVKCATLEDDAEVRISTLQTLVIRDEIVENGTG